MVASYSKQTFAALAPLVRGRKGIRQFVVKLVMFKNRDFLHSLIENSSDVITILKDDGTVLFQSPAVERLFGYTENELVGTNAFRLVHPDDLSGVIDTFNRVINDPGVLLTLSYRFKHKYGGWRIKRWG